MDGLLFLLFWIGGASIHTLIELRWKSAGGETITPIEQRVERQRKI